MRPVRPVRFVGPTAPSSAESLSLLRRSPLLFSTPPPLFHSLPSRSPLLPRVLWSSSPISPPSRLAPRAHLVLRPMLPPAPWPPWEPSPHAFLPPRVVPHPMLLRARLFPLPIPPPALAHAQEPSPQVCAPRHSRRNCTDLGRTIALRTRLLTRTACFRTAGHCHADCHRLAPADRMPSIETSLNTYGLIEMYLIPSERDPARLRASAAACRHPIAFRD
ncbi:unnamed protein product [Closterium sp. NIES-53]